MVHALRSQHDASVNPTPDPTARGRGARNKRPSARIQAEQRQQQQQEEENRQRGERERQAEEERVRIVREQQEEGARILQRIQEEEEAEGRTQQRRRAIQGRTTPDSPPITARGRNAMEAAGLRGSGSTHAARKARDEWATAQQREIDAAVRGRAREERENEEWEAEIAQFGEEEAARRRREVREWRRKKEDLPTSEIEEMDLEDQQANPMLSLKAALRVNKDLKWAHSLGTMTLDTFSIWDFEQSLAKIMSENDALRKGWEVTTRIAHIKSNHSRAKTEQQSMQELSEAEWAKVANVIRMEATKFRPELSVKLEISATALSNQQLKRSRDVLSSDPIEETTPQPRRRVTTTERRLDQARERAETLQAVGNFDKAIVDRWQCKDAHCTNKDGFCFVDFAGKHYDISHDEQLLWSRAIANGQPNVSLERPPTGLYNIWVGRNGPVTQTSRRSEAHQTRLEAREEREHQEDWMKQLIELSKEEMKMNMADRMADKLDRMSRRRDEQQYSSSQWLQQPSYPGFYPSTQMQWPGVPPPSSSYTPTPIQPQSQQWPVSQWPATSQLILPTPTPPQPAPSSSAPPQSTRPAPEQPPRESARSSPIVSTRYEEEGVLEEFFKWQITSCQGPRSKERWGRVQDIVLDQAWTIDDLKGMSDPSSRIYSLAIDRGIPDGIARSLKDDLKIFKHRWREARELLELRSAR